MAKVKIHAGDFPLGDGHYVAKKILLPMHNGDGFLGKTVEASDIESLEVASEESVKRIGGSIVWGLAGAAVLGPLGLLAGLMAGGRGKEVTFVAKFNDGKKMLASTDSKTFTQLQALAF